MNYSIIKQWLSKSLGCMVLTNEIKEKCKIEPWKKWVAPNHPLFCPDSNFAFSQSSMQ